MPVATALVGLIITVALSIASNAVYQHDERHLLQLRVRDAGSVVTSAVPGIQMSLASAAELADVTGGNAAKFTRFMAPYVGAGRQFAFVSLWRATSPRARPLVVLGNSLARDPRVQEPNLVARAAVTGRLEVVGLLNVAHPRIGYAYATPGVSAGFVVYAESRLPADKRSPIGQSSAFAGLNYALYLGHDQAPKNLLLTSVARPPLAGTTASIVTAFGTSALTLVMAARGTLTGSLPRDLPWIILIGGLLLSGAAGLGTLSLTQRRRTAEELAGELERTAVENRRLYAEQRNIAHTLQQALLPDQLPKIGGLDSSAIYHAGEDRMDVGGDWYDLVQIDDGRALLVVGDVSGRGLQAATTMAALRYAIRAYAVQDDAPHLILSKLSELLSVENDGQLATVLCVLIDVEEHTITVTSAGHLQPLLIRDGTTEYVQSPVGLPIGVGTGAAYDSMTVPVSSGTTLLAFTDGLVERRGELLDVGLDRLASAAQAREQCPLAELVSELVAGVAGESHDDIAIVGLRWNV